MNQTVLWSVCGILLSFCLCYILLTFLKPNFVLNTNSKKKSINYTKISLVSIILSLTVGVVIFTLTVGGKGSEVKPVEVKKFDDVKIPDGVVWRNPLG